MWATTSYPPFLSNFLKLESLANIDVNNNPLQPPFDQLLKYGSNGFIEWLNHNKAQKTLPLVYTERHSTIDIESAPILDSKAQSYDLVMMENKRLKIEIELLKDQKISQEQKFKERTNSLLRTIEDVENHRLCLLCLEMPRDVVFLPCRYNIFHMDTYRFYKA